MTRDEEREYESRKEEQARKADLAILQSVLLSIFALGATIAAANVTREADFQWVSFWPGALVLMLSIVLRWVRP